MALPSAADVFAITDTQAVTFTDRLSVSGVPARRSKAPVMSPGVAPVVSSDVFKTPVYMTVSIWRGLEPNDVPGL